MKQKNRAVPILCAVSIAAGVVMTGTSGPGFASDRDRHDGHRSDQRSRDHRDYDHHDSRRDKDRYHAPRVIYHGTRYVVPSRRVRHYRDIVIIRPYGNWYYGYGHVHFDDDAFKWLAFTAIVLKLLDNLNEQQQREHEAAQVKATTAPIGERVIWSEGGAHGSVTAVREGTSTLGRYCREFLQEIVIGGKKEQAYGTACRQPDGSWEVISTRPSN